MKNILYLFILPFMVGFLISCEESPREETQENTSSNEENESIIVTQENFPQAYTNMRLAAVIKKAGGINTFFEMPVPPSEPEKQFVVRMNRDTYYSVSVIDMSSDEVYVNFATIF